MRVLIIEDEDQLAKALQKGLEYNLYVVDISLDGEDGYMMAKTNDYDLIILDLNLPKMDGIDICKSLRNEGRNMPIIMLTARRGTDEKVVGLDAGADDYLTKPFELKELLARMRALLRRGKEEKTETLNVGGLKMNPKTYEVGRDGDTLTLRKKEYMILEYLMRNPGRAVSKTELLEHAWDTNAEYWGNVVEAQIKNLRKQVDKNYKFKMIKTVPGIGYKLVAPDNA